MSGIWNRKGFKVRKSKNFCVDCKTYVPANHIHGVTPKSKAVKRDR